MEYKIESKLEGEGIMVKAKYSKGKKVVHEINTAFPMDTPIEEIQAEVEKAGELFESEQEQKKVQQVVDEKFDKANETINKLNNL